MDVSSAAAWLAGPDADRKLASGTVGAAAYRRARPYLDRNRSASRGVVRRTREVQPSALAWCSRRIFIVAAAFVRRSRLRAFRPSRLSPPTLLEPAPLVVWHGVGVFRCRKRSRAHVRDVGAERRLNRVANPPVLFDESRDMAGRDAEKVVPDEHLPVARGTGADPDRRDVKPFGHARRDGCGNGLEDHRKAAGRLERAGLVHDVMGGFSRAALGPVAAQL